MTTAFIKLTDTHFLKFEHEDGKIQLFDVHWEHITPGNPAMHWVAIPRHMFDQQDARGLLEFLKSALDTDK